MITLICCLLAAPDVDRTYEIDWCHKAVWGDGAECTFYQGDKPTWHADIEYAWRFGNDPPGQWNVVWQDVNGEIIETVSTRMYFLWDGELIPLDMRGNHSFTKSELSNFLESRE